MRDYRAELEQILGKNEIDFSRPLVVWGTGNTSELYQKGFKRDEIDPEFYADGNACKTGNLYHGKKVLSPDEIKSEEYRKYYFLVCSAVGERNQIICDRLSSLQREYMPADKYIFSKNYKKILKVYDLLEDDISKRVYAEMIIRRALNLSVSEDIYTENQYFCLRHFKRLFPDEVFVDAGAFVGDTVEKYIWEKMGTFKTCYAIEPDKKNVMAMNSRFDRLKKEWMLDDDRLIVIDQGLGATREVTRFSEHTDGSRGLGSIITDDGEQEIRISTIDELFEKQKISWLKADVESFEFDMLKGAANVIKRDKPLLSISIYHNAEDLFDIPLLISELDPSYKLSVRHHTYEYSDTVLYAYH